MKLYPYPESSSLTCKFWPFPVRSNDLILCKFLTLPCLGHDLALFCLWHYLVGGCDLILCGFVTLPFGLMSLSIWVATLPCGVVKRFSSMMFSSLTLWSVSMLQALTTVFPVPEMHHISHKRICTVPKSHLLDKKFTVLWSIEKYKSTNPKLTNFQRSLKLNNLIDFIDITYS